MASIQAADLGFKDLAALVNYDQFQERLDFLRKEYERQIMTRLEFIKFTLVVDGPKYKPHAIATTGLISPQSHPQATMVRIAISINGDKYSAQIAEVDEFRFSDQFAHELGEKVFGKPASFFLEQKPKPQPVY